MSVKIGVVADSFPSEEEHNKGTCGICRILFSTRVSENLFNCNYPLCGFRAHSRCMCTVILDGVAKCPSCERPLSLEDETKLKTKTMFKTLKLEQRMDKVEQRLDTIEQRLDQIDTRLDTVNEKLGIIITRLG